jgi:hypothetical protein
VVLEAGEPGQPPPGIGGDQQLAHRSRLVGLDRRAVEQPGAAHHRAVLAGERGADDLHPGAHGEQHRTALDGVVHRTVGAEGPGRLGLGSVLAAAEQVEVEALGHRGAGVDLDDLGVDPPPLEPLAQHERVAAVPVRPEQGGEQEPDAHGRLARRGATGGHDAHRSTSMR